MIVVHPTLPLADGIPFNDAERFLSHQLGLLIARGLVWCTAFEANGKSYSGTVIAANREAAAAIADARGLGEHIVGRCAAAGSRDRLPDAGPD